MNRLLASFVVLMALPTTSWACSCAPLDQSKGYIELLHEQVAAAALVVQAKVETLQEKDGKVLANVTVEKAFKGNPAGSITVSTPNDSAACEYPFEQPGTRHLLFIYDDEDGNHKVNVCGRSRPMDEARRVINPLLDADLLTRLRDIKQ